MEDARPGFTRRREEKKRAGAGEIAGGACSGTAELAVRLAGREVLAEMADPREFFRNR